MMQINGHNCAPIFAIQDVKSSVFEFPIWGGLPWQTDASGIRYFIALQKDNYASSYRWYNPADYRLYRVGYFDIDSGEIVSDKPELILDGASLDISDWEREEL